jgi:N,N'-diacetyllegionaminate synthase
MSDILWVAEIGSMHKGCPALAYEMIRRYAEAGATICKFQFGWTREAQEKFGHAYNPVRYVDPFAEDLAKWCAYFGVELMASIWSLEGLETARKVGMISLKIAHQVWEKDQELAGAILNEGQETYVSGDFADVPLSAFALYCVPRYPTYPKDLGMPEYFDQDGKSYFGYSDHTHGIEACLLAAARGARYIEKHCALDKTDLITKDTPFSATPEEFQQLVKIGNGMRRLLDAAA